MAVIFFDNTVVSKLPIFNYVELMNMVFFCLQTLHRHFSAWYNLVLDRRLKMGKARAMYDWKLMLRAWNAWRSYIRSRHMVKETKQQEQDVIKTQRLIFFALFKRNKTGTRITCSYKCLIFHAGFIAKNTWMLIFDTTLF